MNKAVCGELHESLPRPSESHHPESEPLPVGLFSDDDYKPEKADKKLKNRPGVNRCKCAAGSGVRDEGLAPRSRLAGAGCKPP